jgi:hypothetical protein
LHKKAEENARQGELVGKEKVLGVDQRKGDEEGAEERGNSGSGRHAETQDAANEEYRCQRFNGRITRRDRCTARAAATAQKEIAQERYVVPRPYWRTAPHAAGARHGEGHLPRDSVDEDIEEAPDQQAQDGGIEEIQCRHGRILSGSPSSGGADDGDRKK